MKLERFFLFTFFFVGFECIVQCGLGLEGNEGGGSLQVMVLGNKCTASDNDRKKKKPKRQTRQD
jgi:hypothetical protein